LGGPGRVGLQDLDRDLLSCTRVHEGFTIGGYKLRYLTVLLSLALASTLTACGDSTGPSGPDPVPTLLGTWTTSSDLTRGIFQILCWGPCPDSTFVCHEVASIQIATQTKHPDRSTVMDLTGVLDRTVACPRPTRSGFENTAHPLFVGTLTDSLLRLKTTESWPAGRGSCTYTATLTSTTPTALVGRESCEWYREAAAWTQLFGDEGFSGPWRASR